MFTLLFGTILEEWVTQLGIWKIWHTLAPLLTDSMDLRLVLAYISYAKDLQEVSFIM